MRMLIENSSKSTSSGAVVTSEGICGNIRGAFKGL